MNTPTHDLVDLLVVGGGIHGCAIARELALRGREVVVLEKSIPGAEASSAAAGILGPHLECSEAGPFLDLCRYSLSLYPGWVEALEQESGQSLGFSRCGGVLVAFDDLQRDHLQSQAAFLSNAKLPGRWMEPAELAAQEPALAETLGGLVLPEEAQVEPRAIMAALPIAARKAGVRFERDTVQHIEPGRSIEVVAQNRSYRARQLVVAAGAWSSTVSGTGLDGGAVRPARGQVVLLRARTPLPHAILFSHRGYVVPREDGRVFCGSTLEFAGFEKAVTAAGVSAILSLAMELVPDLAEAELVDAWSGFRPYTSDHMPLLGLSTHDNLWLATGHYRNGILLAPATASVMADLVLGRQPELDTSPFDPRRSL